jgi:hypothetical protein
MTTRGGGGGGVVLTTPKYRIHGKVPHKYLPGRGVGWAPANYLMHVILHHYDWPGLWLCLAASTGKHVLSHLLARRMLEVNSLEKGKQTEV